MKSCLRSPAPKTGFSRAGAALGWQGESIHKHNVIGSAPQQTNLASLVPFHSSKLSASLQPV